MEYRNSGVATHLGKGFISGVDGDSGIEQQGSTILPASDSAAAGLTVRAKGTGPLNLGDSSNSIFIGGSTTKILVVTGQSTTTLPNMPANSAIVSTMTVAGISTGDIILAVDARGTLSTEIAMGGYTITGANEISVTWVNPHASSIAAETTGVTMRWAYLDRT